MECTLIATATKRVSAADSGAVGDLSRRCFSHGRVGGRRSGGGADCQATRQQRKRKGEASSSLRPQAAHMFRTSCIASRSRRECRTTRPYAWCRHRQFGVGAAQRGMLSPVSLR